MATKNQTIGRYEVLQSVGRGSQGSVYLARDPTLDRRVAIKILTASAAELNRLTDDGAPLEARIAGKLKHPNIIPIFDAGECDAGPYLVFEFVQGKTLADKLKAEGPMSIADAAPLIAGILKGVAVAHASEIVHLDLSPRNILIDTDGMPRIMDFGLAQYVSRAREPSEFATGTLRYMAPEHFRGKPLGTWTDVFALGSSFFEIVTGFKAMQGATVEQIQHRIIAGDVDVTTILGLEHGAAFASFLAGALEKSQEGRYCDAAVMKEAFELFLEESNLAEVARTAGATHSTIEFLLRRMQRTGDFPTISRTLSDINRLTGDDSEACADKLANVILRDFSLTGKLLKLVNSAFYGARATEITSISQAVVFLGVEKVRMTANSLTFFGQMRGDSKVLKDSMTKSFFSGLVSRHLAQAAKLRDAEEAFIAGMCQNLGENLVIYYFSEEYDGICELQREKSLDKAAAARGVLGVGYPDLGAAVAKAWNLPVSITDAIRGVPPGPLVSPECDADKLRDIAVFANELCDLFLSYQSEDVHPRMLELLERFDASVSLSPAYCAKLIAAGFEKLKQYAPIFEINVASSRYCTSVQHWLDDTQAGSAADGSLSKAAMDRAAVQ
ncbi:MAG: HDOD domain-containing protein [Gammaproteobacteria bacterium]|nr:HDOD domain-containing protein [Gammaproteobacteria bacterium]